MQCQIDQLLPSPIKRNELSHTLISHTVLLTMIEGKGKGERMTEESYATSSQKPLLAEFKAEKRLREHYIYYNILLFMLKKT